MSTVTDSLDMAREHRRTRTEQIEDARIDEMLDRVGLTEDRCLELAAGPDARQKLKGILKRLARQKHPFTQCMRDLRKHRADLPEESRKRICGRLKSMIKDTGRVKALSLSDDEVLCAGVDTDVATLLSNFNEEALHGAS